VRPSIGDVSPPRGEKVHLTGIESAVPPATVASRGHFLYESGHHGDLWLDLDALLVDAHRARGWASALAREAATCQPELVCGPLTGGAFVAQLLAAELGVGFVFSERVSDDRITRYRIPGSLRKVASGRRVLLVDDAINAGSALLSTLTDLSRYGARLAGFACLISLGEAASRIAEQNRAPLYRLGSLERGMWAPEDCPLCAAGTPLIDRLAAS
jgi:orotate phosphoribosyltransferase